LNQIVLSICITTRNRAPFLVETLSAFLAQANAAVEIVVLDAASSDGTRSACEELAACTSYLSYYRREENEGIDRDYANVAKLARGEHIWFMSDDDLPAPGAVEQILQACRAGYDLIVVNAEDWNDDFSAKIGGARLPLRDNREFDTGQFLELFETVGHFLSFLPGVVIRREIWQSREKERYFGSFFAHVGVLFQAPLPGPALVLAEPLVRIRNGNLSWTGRSFEIWMFRWPALISSLEAIPGPARTKVSPLEPWKSPAKLIEFRAMGAYSSDEYRKWIAPRRSPRYLKVLAYGIAVSPGALVNFLCLGYLCCCARERQIPRFHLRTSRFHYRIVFSRLRQRYSLRAS